MQSRNIVRRVLRYLVGCASALLLSLALGCVNERVTRDNYERIQIGMPMEQVEDVLGKPSRQHEHDCYYEGRYGTIKIEVKRDSVHEKSWKRKR